MFFFVVGLEIRREVLAGELRDRRTATLPVVAAIGGIGPEERCRVSWRARVARILPGSAAVIVGSLGGGPRAA